MQFRNVIVLLLLTSPLAGCGGGPEATTDPSQLKPLTEAEKAEIKKQDEAVAAEEGQSIKYDTKKK